MDTDGPAEQHGDAASVLIGRGERIVFAIAFGLFAAGMLGAYLAVKNRTVGVSKGGYLLESLGTYGSLCGVVCALTLVIGVRHRRGGARG